MPALIAIIKENGAVHPDQIPYAQGGIIVAGLVYLVFALLVYLIGVDRVKKLFPPVVTGPVIVVIGVGLSSTAINDCTGTADLSQGIDGAAGLNIGIALFTLVMVVVFSIFAKGFFKLVPILLGIASGYLLCVILHFTGVFTMDFFCHSKFSLV